ncbi:hypothetical protein CCHOA_00915 [Corynebacterium choanae]|uniref:Uncharacterized protein n=1 Tax=Corynebacterium choanae TaxID=1862358 RepID=A0A3G6J3V8_9CORY|nr:hypothetical protein CCHOA_00915 [Corynebacterium choanae]
MIISFALLLWPHPLGVSEPMVTRNDSRAARWNGHSLLKGMMFCDGLADHCVNTVLVKPRFYCFGRVFTRYIRSTFPWGLV